MKAAYCEIKRGRNCVTVNYYSKEGYGLELGCRKLERERREAATAAERRGQVGSGDRSEKIRTYRFFQGQVVEQRLTGEERYFNLKDILDGDLDPLIDALVTADRAEKLKNGGEES